MYWPPLVYLLPHAVALVIELLVAFYAVKRHHVRGALLFALMVLCQAWWTLGYVLELGTPFLDGKIFWDNLQFLGAAGWVLAFFAFGLAYTRTRLVRPRLIWGANSLVVGGYLLLVFLDARFHLIRPTAELVEEGELVALVYPFTTTTWLVYGYACVLFGVTTWTLLRHARASRAPYRSQAVAVVTGTLIPFAGGMFTLAGAIPGPFRDISPLTFAIGNVVIAWGLFRYRFLDLVPVARDVVFDNLRDMVCVLDERHRLIDGNRALFDALDRRREEVIGRLDRDVFARWGPLLERFRKLDTARAVIDVELAGRPRSLELSLDTILDQRGRPIARVFVTHDVTELKQAELALKRTNDDLRGMNEELDAFSYSVSHDLRAPARVMAGFSKRLLERAGGDLDADARKLVERIEVNARRMQELIDDLLAFSRLGRQPLSLVKVDPAAIVKLVMADLEGETATRNVKFELGELPPAQADPSLLRQVFANLLGNAVKFTKGKDPAVIRIGARVEGGVPVYFVADNGVGFDMGQSARLFAVFQRLHSAEAFEGTGIGLASTKRIVSRHGGKIWAESSPGEGATFFFTLEGSQQGVASEGDSKP
jgi:PAS domain S-box-containing protein